jgi:replicative DNA helicase
MDQILTPDMKLIHAILRSGDIKSYFLARKLGVRPEALLDAGARGLFELIGKLVKQGRLPSLPEVQEVAGNEFKLSADPIDVELIANGLVKRGLREQLIKGFRDIYTDDRLATEPDKVRDDLTELVKSTAWSFGEPSSMNDRASIEAILASYEKAARVKSGLLGLSSPWPTVDAASLGLQGGELTVLFAKRKVGKSWLTIAWAVHNWRNDLKPGERLLFVTMEMTELQVMRRMAAIDLKLSWSDLRGGKLTSSQVQQLESWCDARIHAPKEDPNIIVLGSNQVRSAADISVAVSEYGPKMVYVDSFYILGRSSAKSLHERVLGNVQELKLDVALQHEVPVLASTQLKGTTSKDVLSADSDDAMGAKAIGDYADVTRGLFMNDQLRAAKERYWRGMESREFEGRDVRINFNLERMDFSEIEEIVDDVAQEEEEDSKGSGSGKKKPRRGRKNKPTADNLADDARNGDEQEFHLP